MNINSHFYFRRKDIEQFEGDNKNGDLYEYPWNEYDSEIVSICTDLGSIKYSVGDILCFSNIKLYPKFVVKSVEYLVGQVQYDDDFDEVQTVYVVPCENVAEEEIDKFR